VIVARTTVLITAADSNLEKTAAVAVFLFALTDQRSKNLRIGRTRYLFGRSWCDWPVRVLASKGSGGTGARKVTFAPFKIKKANRKATPRETNGGGSGATTKVGSGGGLAKKLNGFASILCGANFS
jgi:hypothetical protein